ncbi:MAG: cytochrome [Verrucomicrobiaceae bacterium]|nr:cytochrome [Verrucomicrobiaceae bacterium]
MSNLSAQRSSAEDLAKTFVQLSQNYAGNCADPYPIYAEKRASSPVYAGDLLRDMGVPSLAAGLTGTRPVYSLLKYADVQAALIDTKTFSLSPYREMFGPVQGETIQMLEGDPHQFWRRMLTNIFQKSVLDSWLERLFAPTILRSVKAIAPRGKAELLGDLMLGFPAEVVYQMIGLPADDKDMLHQFQEWALLMAMGGLADFRNPEQAVKATATAQKALDELTTHITKIVAERRRQGATGDDLLSAMINARVDGQALSDFDVIQFTRSLLPAAAETTTRSFANAMALLLERPDQLNRLREDRSLIMGAMNEALRYEATAGALPRVTTRDVEVRGVTIPEGTGVNLLVNAANRDEDAYPNAENFDITRRGKAGLGFGYGPHMCMGLQLAKMEMESALNAMFDHMPNLRLDPDADFRGVQGIHFRTPPSVPVIWDC